MELLEERKVRPICPAGEDRKPSPSRVQRPWGTVRGGWASPLSRQSFAQLPPSLESPQFNSPTLPLRDCPHTSHSPPLSSHHFLAFVDPPTNDLTNDLRLFPAHTPSLFLQLFVLSSVLHPLLPLPHFTPSLSLVPLALHRSPPSLSFPSLLTFPPSCPTRTNIARPSSPPSPPFPSTPLLPLPLPPP